MKRNIVVGFLVACSMAIYCQNNSIILPKFEFDSNKVIKIPDNAICPDSVFNVIMRLYPTNISLSYDKSYTTTYYDVVYTTVYINNQSVNKQPLNYDGYDPSHGRYEHRYYNANPGVMMTLPAPPPLPRSVPYYYIKK